MKVRTITPANAIATMYTGIPLVFSSVSDGADTEAVGSPVGAILGTDVGIQVGTPVGEHKINSAIIRHIAEINTQLQLPNLISEGMYCTSSPNGQTMKKDENKTKTILSNCKLTTSMHWWIRMMRKRICG